MKKRLSGILFSLVLMLTMMPALGTTAYATQQDPVTYLDSDGVEKTCETYTVVTSSDGAVTWNGGWYVVSSNVTISGQIKATGNVNIILCDDAKLTVSAGSEKAISFQSDNNSLTIYGQKNGSGELEAASSSWCISNEGGDITINGGKVTATGGTQGIHAQNVTINGGSFDTDLNAEGSYGIFSNSDVTITDGTVTAKGPERGISAGNDLTISGGTVAAEGTAANTSYGLYASGKVSINGGDVTATGGSQCIYGSVEIADGVNVMAGDDEGSAKNVTSDFESYHNRYKWAHMFKLDPVPYMDWDETGKKLVEKTGDEACKNYTVVGESVKAWGADGTTSWYVVNSEVVIDDKIIARGDVRLIICDGAKLTINNGYGDAITTNGLSGFDLTIYGQSQGTGELIANGGYDGNGINVIKNGDAYGGLTINGVSVTATGDDEGIKAQRDISINGGEVNATGKDQPGIYAANITIENGNVIAKTKNSYYKETIIATNDVTINGGSVNATGGKVGICSNNGDAMITGGVVTADGSGCGIQAKEDLAISNSTVNATGGTSGTLSKNITISGSKVSVKGTGDRSSGIYTGSEGEDVIISSGEINVEGKSYGIDANRNVMINGGKVTATGTGTSIPSYGISANNEITIKGGTVVAAGSTASGIDASNSNNVIIEGGSVTATGAEKGIGGTVINSITGTGWTDTGGTTGKEDIAVSDQGQDLSRFRKVQFPAVRDPAKVTKAPAAMNLIYSGSPQLLVTAGEADGGTMQYALGSASGASGSYSPSIPMGTDAGDYYVWYKAVGDSAHIDSDAACVKVTIAEKGSDPTPAKTVKSITVNSATVSAKTLDAAVKKAGGNKNTVTTITLGKKVKKISKGAFKNYKKAKTLVVKTKKLKKATVKNSLKGSKITKVKVKIGKKKTNKSYVKKYKKIFTKKNAGKKVKVSL